MVQPRAALSPASARARRTAAAGCALPVLAAAAGLGLAPVGASAATVAMSEVQAYKGDTAQYARAIYTAAAGERNQLEVTVSGSDPAADLALRKAPVGPLRAAGATGAITWTFRDAGAAITVGAGCALADAHTATCTTAEPRSYVDIPQILLGDGDDTADLGAATETDGGEGNDTIRVIQDDGATSGIVKGGKGDDLLDASLGRAAELRGDSGGDLLTGSTQDDVLFGGSGSDELRGGQGRDQLIGEGGADRFSCGPGNDRSQFDASDRLLDPNAPTLGVSDGGFARQTPLHDPANDETNGSRTELRTDCENLGIPAAKAPYRFDVQSPAGLTATTLTLGRRTSAPRTGTFELRDASGHVLGRALMANKVLRVRLTPLGVKTFEPGTRATVRIVTRPLGPKSSGTRGKGIEVDLSIKPADS